jgi:hypothetical protein
MHSWGLHGLFGWGLRTGDRAQRRVRERGSARRRTTCGRRGADTSRLWRRPGGTRRRRLPHPPRALRPPRSRSVLPLLPLRLVPGASSIELTARRVAHAARPAKGFEAHEPPTLVALRARMLPAAPRAPGRLVRVKRRRCADAGFAPHGRHRPQARQAVDLARTHGPAAGVA